jgi:CheY-like chemotaxis protein
MSQVVADLTATVAIGDGESPPTRPARIVLGPEQLVVATNDRRVTLDVGRLGSVSIGTAPDDAEEGDSVGVLRVTARGEAVGTLSITDEVETLERLAGALVKLAVDGTRGEVTQARISDSDGAPTIIREAGPVRVVPQSRRITVGDRPAPIAVESATEVLETGSERPGLRVTHAVDGTAVTTEIHLPERSTRDLLRDYVELGMVAHRGGPIRVLLVDDEPGLVGVLGDLLEDVHSGIRVETARTVEDGVEVVENGDVDCVVSDYRMGATTGIEFMERVRALDPELPFVLYTRVEPEELPDGEVPDGVDAFLTKDSGREHYRTLAGHIDRAVAERRGMPVDG